MSRFTVSNAGRVLLAMVVVGGLSGAAVAADRNVLGEYFTATW